MEQYQPPFHMTDDIVMLLTEISEQIGRISVLHGTVNPRLRRANRIRTIHASLAIEQNTLSLGQVTAIVRGRRVLGNPNEIKEVQNAYEAYEMMLRLDPLSVHDLLVAHGQMMAELISESGRFRTGDVGVFAGERLVHMAPPAHLVAEHIQNLMEWYARTALHPLLKSAIFHYEFEFIHPFADGNGRMGRMWHTLLLGQWKEVLFWLPVEELIRARQQEYYDALGAADAQADSTGFVTLILCILRDAIAELDRTPDQESDQVRDQVMARDADLQRLLCVLGDDVLSAAELMARFGLSHRPSFRRRYLAPALAAGLIERTIPDKPQSSKQRYRRCKR